MVLADGFRAAVTELTGGRGVDIVVDPVGGDRFTDSLRSLAPAGRLNLRLYRLDAPVPLSQSLPMLERMGVKVMDERPSEIVRQDGSVVWLHDFGLSFSAAETLNIHDIQPLFHDTFRRVWSGEVENDDFNRLVLLAGLSWREVSVLRAYAKHMRQAAFTFSQAYME